MAKHWFLDYFGAAVAKSVVRDCCRDMELTELETRLVLERFCDKKGMGPCGVFYPEDQQKQHLPDLEPRCAAGWNAIWAVSAPLKSPACTVFLPRKDRP